VDGICACHQQLNQKCIFTTSQHQRNGENNVIAFLFGIQKSDYVRIFNDGVEWNRLEWS